MMKAIRWILGRIILALDWLTLPKGPEHTPETQASLDAATSGMALYEFRACPFCVRTRRTIRRLGLNIELRDAKNDPAWQRELIAKGGKYQVPCLCVKGTDDEQWMYESRDINRYLESRFAKQA